MSKNDLGPEKTAELIAIPLKDFLGRPSLRDQFAMAALTGLVGGYWKENKDNDHAKYAYSLADAMLAEREKKCTPKT